MAQGEFIDFSDFLTDSARSSLEKAEHKARNLGSIYIGTEHILLGLLSENDSVGSRILDKMGVTLERAQMALNLTPRALVINTGARGLSETAKLTLRMSWDVAQEFNQDYCGTEHILYSILTQKNARATVLLKDMNIDVDALTGELESFLHRQQTEFEQNLNADPRAKRRAKRGKNGFLDNFGIDLTDKARAGELDPMIGRENQLRRMVTILGRRIKSNPVLIGEPGVGKTAIVEGLAQAIIDEDVPEHLLDNRIVSLDLAGMIAGTKYRGEFEERLKKTVEEIVQDPKLIVFIDELHLLVGAGAAEGAIDAANMLKPALARGKLRLIGATTLDEYRKHVEKDAALERRMQTVVVNEPTPQEAIKIVRGIKTHYEDHHNVSINDDMAAEAVRMAERFISDKFLPDKAIDVLDETAAHVRVERGKTDAAQKRLQREVEAILTRIDDAVEGEDYEKAAMYKTRLSRMEKKLAAVKEKNKSKRNLVMKNDDIAETISRSTGIPVTQLMRKEANYLRTLHKHLQQSVIGQEDATQVVASAIRRNRIGLGSEQKPIGSFVFLGPTGVGKTELARVLAREVFGSKEALVKIDMSEFGEKHTSSRLLGAPAGYVGYDDGGQLTEKIRRQPYSVVLFDEIEKAHPDVLNMLLQALEDGYISDGKGRRVSLTNTIIILTSNLGAEKMQKEANFGFQVNSAEDERELKAMHEQHDRAARDELKKFMRPELINRFDKVVVFRALTHKDTRAIARLQIEELNQRLSGKHLNVKMQPAAYKILVEAGYDPHNGVRPLRRTIQEMIEDRLADGLLSGEFKKGDALKVGGRRGKLVFDVEKG